MEDDETRHMTEAQKRAHDGEPCAIPECIRPAKHEQACMDAGGNVILSVRAALADYLAIQASRGQA